MKKACERDADTDAIHLAHPAKIVCRQMFSKKCCFTGTYDSQCQVLSLPSPLVALVSMILWSKNTVKLHLDIPGSVDIVTAVEVQQLCTMPR